MKNNFKARLLSLSLAVSMLSPMGVATTAFADGDASSAEGITSFKQDFEGIDTTREYVDAYANKDSTEIGIHFLVETEAAVAKTTRMLKKGKDNPYNSNSALGPDGKHYKPTIGYWNQGSSKQDNGENIPNTGWTNYYYEQLNAQINKDTSDYVQGGIEDYYAFSFGGWAPNYYGCSGNEEEKTSYDLLVMKETDGNQALAMHPHVQQKISRLEGENASVFGKNGLKLDGKINLIKTDVKIDTEGTDARGFRLSITKDDKLDTYTANNSGFEHIDYLYGCNTQTSAYDAVLFYKGNVYMGPDFGTQENITAPVICKYETGKYYTVEYYLDLSNVNAPKHMVRILDGDAIVGEKSCALNLTESTTSTLYTNGWGDRKDNAKSLVGDRKFTAFDTDADYGVMTSMAAKTKGTTAYVDNLSLETVTEVPEEGLRFKQDFESYNDEINWTTVYFDSSADSTGTISYMKENNRSAGWTTKLLKSDVTNPFDEGCYTQDEDGMYRPKTDKATTTGNDYTYKNLTSTITDGGKFTLGGLPGYFGVASYDSYPRTYGSGQNAAYEPNAYDLMVVTESDNNNALRLNPQIWGNTWGRDLYSMFGKNKLDFNGKVNKVSVDVKVEHEDEYAEGFRLSISKNDTLETDLNLNKGKNWMNAMFQQIKIRMYDAVMFRDGKVYLGPNFGSAENITAPVVCSYEKGKYYTVEYYLDLSNLSVPKHTVRIYNGDVLVGEASKDIAVGEGLKTTLGNKSFNDHTSNNIGPSDQGGERKFNGFNSGDTYGVILSNAVNDGTKEGKEAYVRDNSVLVDNFSYYVVDEVEEHGFEFGGSVNAAAKTVTATVFPGNEESKVPTVSTVFAAEYDSATGKLLQFAKAENGITADALSQDIVFANDFTANSKIKIFLWKNLNDMEAVTASVNVR